MCNNKSLIQIEDLGDQKVYFFLNLSDNKSCSSYGTKNWFCQPPFVILRTADCSQTFILALHRMQKENMPHFSMLKNDKTLLVCNTRKNPAVVAWR